jgi:hypothetical protein
MIEAKAFRTFIRIYSLFKSERLRANILAADTYLFKLKRLENKFLHTIGSLPRFTPVSDLHTAFNLPYVYDYITKLCRQQAEVIQNHGNEHVRNMGQGEARHRKYKRLELGAHQFTTVQAIKLPL